jgi:predicted aminopeptidase
LSRLVLLLLFLGFCTGCTSLHYLTQAAAGQEDINVRGIAIDEIVEGHHLDKRTRELLANVPRIKAFGEAHGLAHTKSYTRYVWLPRAQVVWIVTACHPLAFAPKVWKFPIVGSITYTGWFDRKEADDEAARLRGKGWDVDVRPSPAYSTLGWFDDPILSTMFRKEDVDALGDLADVVLHETLHATYYVPGQSTLNESVASFFGDGLSVQYMDEVLGPDAPEKKAFLATRVRSEKRAKRMQVAYLELEALYASKKPREEKLAEKAAILEKLEKDLRMTRHVTNATLIQYKTYGSGKEQLNELLQRCGGDYKRLLAGLQRVKPIARTAPPHTDPARLLDPVLHEGGCEQPALGN